MSELSDGGQKPVTVEMVRTIVERIGEPEILCDRDPVTEDAANVNNEDTEKSNCSQKKPRRKLFRDIDHKMLGGVFSGLGCYLDINPLWLRILAILLACGSFGVMVVIYLVCWVSIPPAVTPTDRLEMKGDPVNMSGIKDEILEQTHSAINSVKNSNGVESVIDTVMKLMCAVFKVILYVVVIGFIMGCGALLLATIVGACWSMLTPLGEMGQLIGTELPLFQYVGSDASVVFWLGIGSLVVLLSITLYMGIHLLMKLTGKGTNMSGWMKCACIVGWVISLIVFCVCMTRLVHVAALKWDRDEPIRMERNLLVRNQERQRSLDLLADEGWKVVTCVNVDDEFTDNGQHYSGNKKRWYIDVESEDGNMIADLRRDVKVAPGRYTLEAVARTDGEGCEIYAVNSSGKRYSSGVPVCGSRGGSVWADAVAALGSDTISAGDVEHLRRIARVHGGKGYGWSRVVIEDIVVGNDSILYYGISNDHSRRSWDGTRFSATSFNLEPIR